MDKLHVSDFNLLDGSSSNCVFNSKNIKTDVTIEYILLPVNWFIILSLKNLG
jgi:hypothetical protein